MSGHRPLLSIIRPPDGPLARARLARQARGAWSFRLYPDALEGGGCWVPASREPSVRIPLDDASDSPRSALEGARRARASVRRYVVANRCDKLITLTYRGAGCHDPARFVADIAAFWVELRRLMGAGVGPYLWVPEWHPKGHGLHAHAGLATYVPVRLIRAAWPHGERVDVKRLSGTPWAVHPRWSPSARGYARGISANTSVRRSMTRAGCWAVIATTSRKGFSRVRSACRPPPAMRCCGRRAR